MRVLLIGRPMRSCAIPRVHVVPKRTMFSALQVAAPFRQPPLPVSAVRTFAISFPLFERRSLSSLSLTNTADSVVQFARSRLHAVRHPYYHLREQSQQQKGFWSAFKRRVNGVPSDWIFYGIIGLNVGVFGLWCGDSCLVLNADRS